MYLTMMVRDPDGYTARKGTMLFVEYPRYESSSSYISESYPSSSEIHAINPESYGASIMGANIAMAASDDPVAALNHYYGICRNEDIEAYMNILDWSSTSNSGEIKENTRSFALKVWEATDTVYNELTNVKVAMDETGNLGVLQYHLKAEITGENENGETETLLNDFDYVAIFRYFDGWKLEAVMPKHQFYENIESSAIVSQMVKTMKGRMTDYLTFTTFTELAEYVMGKGEGEHLRPTSETTTFLTIDEEVKLWLHFTNVHTSHDVVAEWYDPDGNFDASTTCTIEQPPGENYWEDYHVLLHMPIKGEEAAEKPGRWTVKVYLDNEELFTTTFQIQSQSDLSDLVIRLLIVALPILVSIAAVAHVRKKRRPAPPASG